MLINQNELKQTATFVDQLIISIAQRFTIGIEIGPKHRPLISSLSKNEDVCRP